MQNALIRFCFSWESANKFCRKLEIMSSLYGPYEPGDTRLTKVITKKGKSASFSKFLNVAVVRIIICTERMKLESIVIVDHTATVKPSLILVHHRAEEKHSE